MFTVMPLRIINPTEENNAPTLYVYRQQNLNAEPSHSTRSPN